MEPDGGLADLARLHITTDAALDRWGILLRLPQRGIHGTGRNLSTAHNRAVSTSQIEEVAFQRGHIVEVGIAGSLQVGHNRYVPEVRRVRIIGAEGCSGVVVELSRLPTELYRLRPLRIGIRSNLYR